MKEIENIKRILHFDNISPEQLDSLMINIRKVLERESLQSTYKVLHLYTNWVAHPVVDRAPAGFVLLEQLTDILLDYMRPHTPKTRSLTPGIFTDITKTLSSELRQNLNDFLFDHRLPTEISVHQLRWRRFFASLVHRLVEQPLSFPDKRTPNSSAGKAWENIRAKTRGSNLAVHSFRYLFKQFPENSNPGGVLQWEIQVAMEDASGLFTMRGPLDI